MVEDGRQGVLPPQNPIANMQARFKDLENGFRDWLSKQSLLVEAAVVTATSAAQGAAIGAIMGTLTGDVSSTFPNPPPQAGLSPPQPPMPSLSQAQAVYIHQQPQFYRTSAIRFHGTCAIVLYGSGSFSSSALMPLLSAWAFCGVDSGLVICMVAAFGSGAMFSLVSGMGGPNQATNVITSGLFFALIQGGLFQLGQKFSQPPVEDAFYARTRGMLTSLGLQNYEKNFKKGLLTDSTLALLTDRQVGLPLAMICFSALSDVKIPPGPRLLILDHIQRDPELKGRR
ncbi:hypothetical protein HHK36_029305 [Tetracentron sinense]|uniref:Uncharacterized protein n=1 Tax=Tetracentron sinense TaxID=13715 RepID=A0A835D3G1_TETSI|nr:hypothetical protein HHK36_029305 [Tetracentron sinense]